MHELRGAAALSKHWALPCAQCHGVRRRILSRDRPAVGKRYNDSTLKSLPRYRGFLVIALLSLARRLFSSFIPPMIPTKFTALLNDTVAGNKESDWVRAYRQPHGSCRI